MTYSLLADHDGILLQVDNLRCFFYRYSSTQIEKNIGYNVGIGSLYNRI